LGLQNDILCSEAHAPIASLGADMLFLGRDTFVAAQRISENCLYSNPLSLSVIIGYDTARGSFYRPAAQLGLHWLFSISAALLDCPRTLGSAHSMLCLHFMLIDITASVSTAYSATGRSAHLAFFCVSALNAVMSAGRGGDYGQFRGV
jgi:hypothetical protein